MSALTYTSCSASGWRVLGPKANVGDSEFAVIHVGLLDPNSIARRRVPIRSGSALCTLTDEKMITKRGFPILLALGATAIALPCDAATEGRVGKRCIATMAPLELSGRLTALAATKVFEWSTTCTGVFSASARGGVTLHIQRQQAGQWFTMSSGVAASMASLGPGTYRMMVENRMQRPVTYTVTHRRGLG